MTRALAALTLVATLAACGADGAPSQPTDTPKPGIAITGSARMGVVKSG